MKSFLTILFVCMIMCVLSSPSLGLAKVKPQKLAQINQGVCEVAIDPSGQPHVAYQGKNYHLYHARYDGRRWTHELVDGTSDCGWGNSIAVDAQGHVHISYAAFRGLGAQKLIYAVHNGTQWQVQEVGRDAAFTHLKLDADGRPHILFKGDMGYGYAKHNGTNWQIEEIPGLPWNWYTDGLALDADGYAHVAASNSYATNKSGTWQVTSLVSEGTAYMSIGVNSQGYPRVAACLSDRLEYFTYDGADWSSELVADSAELEAEFPPGTNVVLDGVALALDGDEKPHFLMSAYISAGEGGVEVSIYGYHDGAGWSGMLLDYKNTGFYPSIAVTSEGVVYGTYSTAIKGNKSQAKWVRITLPDLTGTWTDVTLTGATVTGTLTVQNNGFDKSAKTTATLWLSDDPEVGQGDVLLRTFKVKSLKPGGVAAIKVDYTHTGQLAGKYLIAVIDPDLLTYDGNLLDNEVAVLLSPP
jgi:hypothetical protein